MQDDKYIMRAFEFLTEALGNLEQLHLGPFVNMLKQVFYGGKSNYTGPINSNKFVRVWSDITSTSDIVDVPKFNGTIVEIKKIYKSKNNEAGKGFTVYIDNAIVAFFIVEEDSISRPSNGYGLGGYDLTKYEKELKDNHDKEQETKSTYYKQQFSIDNYKNNRTRTTYRDEVEHYQGQGMSVGEIQNILNKIKNTADLVNGTLSAKVIFEDKTALTKRYERTKIKNLPGHETQEELLNKLNIRLQKYKLSKKPTANSIDEFLKMTISHAGKIVQFAGRSYKMEKEEGYGNSYYSNGKPVNISPLEVLNGRPFSVAYREIDPAQKYNSNKLEIFYVFDNDDQTLQATHAEWTEDTKKTGLLNPIKYVKLKLKGKPFTEENVLDILKNTDLDNAVNISKSILDAGYKWSDVRQFFKQASWDQMIKTSKL